MNQLQLKTDVEIRYVQMQIHRAGPWYRYRAAFVVRADAPPFRVGDILEHEFHSPWLIKAGDRCDLILCRGSFWLVPSDVDDQMFEATDPEPIRQTLIQIGAWVEEAG